MNAVSRHCKGGTCITYPTCGLFLELVRINTGTCLYNALQRSEVPLTLSFALTVGMSPIRGHFILVMFLSDVFCPAILAMVGCRRGEGPWDARLLTAECLKATRSTEVLRVRVAKCYRSVVRNQ